jgi:hypothetical protein
LQALLDRCKAKNGHKKQCKELAPDCKYGRSKTCRPSTLGLCKVCARIGSGLGLGGYCPSIRSCSLRGPCDDGITIRSVEECETFETDNQDVLL